MTLFYQHEVCATSNSSASAAQNTTGHLVPAGADQQSASHGAEDTLSRLLEALELDFDAGLLCGTLNCL